MLYELICSVRPGNLTEVKEIARRSGNAVLASGGVVRGITNWGAAHLPNVIRRKDQGTFHHAHRFVLRFDASPRAQHAMRQSLTSDPRVLSYHILGLGRSLADTVNTPARTGWGVMRSQEDVDAEIRKTRVSSQDTNSFERDAQYNQEQATLKVEESKTWSAGVAAPSTR